MRLGGYRYRAAATDDVFHGFFLEEAVPGSGLARGAYASPGEEDADGVTKPGFARIDPTGRADDLSLQTGGPSSGLRTLSVVCRPRRGAGSGSCGAATLGRIDRHLSLTSHPGSLLAN
ncbi:MAG: hypothetical protein ABJA81_09310 [Nocardioidaceae bacterium]